MARGPLIGYIFRVVPNQFINTNYYDPDFTNQGYTVAWLARLRTSALVFADLLSAFALFQMMNYLTDVWNLSTTHAAGIINIFGGITATLVIVFDFFADAFLGDVFMLVLSSIAYSVGLGLLSLSTPTFSGLCSDFKEECIGHKQKVMFFTSLPLIAVGMAGHFVALPSFIEKELEPQAQVQAEPQAQARAEPKVEAKNEIEIQAETEPKPQAQAQAELQVQAKNEIMIQSQPEPKPRAIISQIGDLLILVLVIVCGGIAPWYVKAYSIRFGVPAICTLTATLLFLTGFSRYKDSKRDESPVKIALRVFTAAASKDFQQVEKYTKTFGDNAPSTYRFRWLNKAATKFPDQEMKKSWTLCSISEIEHIKTGLRTVPMLLTLLGTGVVLSLVNTYFLAQANHMDRKLGTIKIQIPFFLLLYTFSSNISQLIDTCALPVTCIPSKIKCNPSNYFAKIEIGIGMVLSVLCCIISAIVETQRLLGLDKSSQMSVFFLLPQIILLGCADGIIYFGIKRFLQDKHVPKSTLKYLLYFPKFVLGLGSMAGVLWVYVVGKLSGRNNTPNWFQHTLNESRLDRYYWTLAGLSAVNLMIYAIVASLDRCKESSKNEEAQ